MTKLLAALVACTISAGAFAQAASAPMPATSGASSDMGASKPAGKHHMKKSHDKKHKEAASKPAA